MGKCLLSQRDIFPTVLTTTLLLLIYAQPIYGQPPAPILDEDEVKTLLAVLTGLNQNPFPHIDTFICDKDSSHSTIIYCNCRVNEPKLKCYPLNPLKSCRNYTTCYVSSIFLSGKQLGGVILPEFGNLPYLEDLNFSSNSLKGSIPKELGSLQKLQMLDVRGNMLSGEIPKELCNINSLEYLNLVNNQFLRGKFNTQLGKLVNLDTLILGRNFLNGSIPKELGAIPSLRILDVGNNILSGEIPEELGNITRLTYLNLASNQLEGKIPTQLGKLVHLDTLFLMGNRLSAGRFPTVLTNITTLKRLNIGSNHFSGTIPLELGNLVNLVYLDVSSNQFTGELPAALAKLTNLADMRISDNNFSGRIPDFISNWTLIEKLYIQGSSLEGPIPTSISALTSLSDLRISDLNGRGSDFPLLSKLKSMKTLILRKCSIHGNIPEYIVNMTQLEHLDLSFNNLTGEIPSSFAKLAKVDFMYFTGNMLTGPIPGWIRERNQTVDVSYNNFMESSGPFGCPTQGKVNLVESYSSAENNLSSIHPCLKKNFPCTARRNHYQSSLYINCGGGEIPMGDDIKYEADMEQRGASMFYLAKGWAFSSTGNFMDSNVNGEKYIITNTSTLSNVSTDTDLYSTARISPLSLTYYGLCLINGNYTVKLHFAEIVYTKDNMINSLGKRMFDVYIQGKLVLKDFNIEDEAGGPSKPIVKNFTAVVASNTLKIQLYWAGKGTTEIPRSGVYGPLISAISVNPNFKPPSLSASNTSTKLLVAVSVSALFLILLVFGILWKKGCFGGKDPIDKVSLPHGKFYNFSELKEATRNFHHDNKIGQGGFGRVYKGVLPNGEEIAVKQLISNTKEGKQEFLNEVGIISAVNHPNLVELLGCCTENNQLLLVYKYMENNSLSSALFGGNLNLKSRLTWQTRFEICLGIAKGLAFLHEESAVKIIHRDIKPTNVLLDKDLKAKISDFGLARHHEEEQPHQTKVGGTSCYVAPEYAMRGHLTYKADVYSFGVVMLEILSGKASTDYRPNDETAFLLDRAYVLYQQGNLLELMDPDLKMNYKENQANRMLNLAMLCTNPAPAVRPKMSEVVSILKGKTELVSVPITAPYSDDGFLKASASAELCRSTHSAGSTSRDGTSDPFFSLDSMAHGETYNFQQLKDATRDFHPDNKIGQGSYGRVYKGELPSGLVIAVKQPVSNSKEGKQAFKNEVAVVTGLDHPNLVKLLGCCFEDNQLLLVYEYMENNSLLTALFGDRNSNLKSRLNWQVRLKICLGIAKGLAYLHEESNDHSNESKLKIIHRNIKPTNILLDKDLNAKLSGFGLAKHHEEKHALGTKVGGTSFYVAPEYATRGLLTYKSDVYNFGAVMLEIVSGKVSTDYHQNDETDYILDRAYVLHQQGNILELMDPDLKMDYKVNQAKRVLNLAMLCTNPAPAVRPKMSEVVSILEGKTEFMSVPIVAPYSADGFQKASAIVEKSGALNAEPKASLRKTKSF